MPRRFPPPEPAPLSRAPTASQVRRYHSILAAWRVGQALRELDDTMRVVNSREMPDDLPYLSSPGFEAHGGRRLAENGTPVSMDALCSWIDHQQSTVRQTRQAFQSLYDTLPRHARVAWEHHVNLLTCEEIAQGSDLSYRTVVRYLGIANLTLSAALNRRSASPTARGLARDSARRAETAEANAWRSPEEELSPEDLTYAGLAPVVTDERPAYRRARVRKR